MSARLARIETPETGAASGQKLECFDSVRGLAALSVLIGHFILGFWPGIYFQIGSAWSDCPGWLQLLFRFPCKRLLDGELMVSIFYVLSGFVLSVGYFRAGGPVGLGSAAVRRYPRLMLPVAASIFLAYFLMTFGAMCNQEVVRRLDETYGFTKSSSAPRPGTSNGWLARHYSFDPSFSAAAREATWGAFASVARYNLPLHTMPVELAGSFTVFAFLALWGSLRNRWLLYVIVGGVCVLAGRPGLLDFIVGMALCDLWWQRLQGNARSLTLGWALALMALGIYVAPSHWHGRSHLVVAAVVFAPRLQGLLAARCFTFLGKLTFGLYVLHMPIFCSMGCGLYLYLGQTLAWSHNAAALTAALGAMLAALAVAWLFQHIVDRPTLWLTRTLDVGLFRPREAAFGPRLFQGSTSAREAA